MQIKKRYTIPNRLSDVIRLITIMSIDEYSFRTISKLDEALRGLPLSAKTWLEIADKHPEFFRPNGDRTSIALLIRSYLPQGENGRREPLSIPETQKLIEVAMNLQEKDIQRRQRNTHLYSLIIAFMALTGAIFGPVYTQYRAVNTDKKIDSLISNVKQIQDRLPVPVKK